MLVNLPTMQRNTLVEIENKRRYFILSEDKRKKFIRNPQKRARIIIQNLKQNSKQYLL